MTDNLPIVHKPQIHTGAQVAALVPQTLDEVYRLADAMSRSGMMPRGIQTPEAVMVAIMAGSEVGFAPFQSVQSIAIINGRPNLWGDAIPALLRSNGFKIREWYENEGEAGEYPNNMVAKCEVTRPDGEVIQGEFSVADAKEAKLWTKEGPWQTAKKRMMKMRARSYTARDGAADVLRGLFVAEEAQDFVALPADNAPQHTGMVERLTARAVDVDTAGFNVRGITAETEAAAPKRRGRPPKAQEVTPEPELATSIGPADGLGEALGNDRRDTVAEIDAEFTKDAKIEATETLLPMTGDAEGEFPPESSGSEYEIRFGNVDLISQGYPEADEVYHLNGDEWAEDDGRRDTYKNGEPFSGATRKAGLAIYEDHAPEAVKAPELAPSDFPPEFNDYIDAVEKATTWNDGLTAMQVFYRTDAFKGMTAAQQNKIRAQTWQTFSDDGTRMTNLPDPAQNASAFRLFTEATEDADAIEGCLRVLENETGFIAKEEVFKNAIRKAAAERMALLRAN